MIVKQTLRELEAAQQKTRYFENVCDGKTLPKVREPS